jgi:hypothetical protein
MWFTLCRLAPKVAVTALEPPDFTVQPPLPVHAPVQPEKVKPLSGAAESVTAALFWKVAAHVPGQLIPAGVLVTVPDPPPAVFTVS